MKLPLFLCPITDEEGVALATGLCSPDTFTVRRCQIWVAIAEGQKSAQIATTLPCAPQTGRNVMHAFDARPRMCAAWVERIAQGRARAER